MYYSCRQIEQTFLYIKVVAAILARIPIRILMKFNGILQSVIPREHSSMAIAYK